jgi:hypothetical protein
VTADAELAAEAGAETDLDVAEASGLDADPDLADVADLEVDPDLADVAFLDVDAELEDLENIEGDETNSDEADVEGLTVDTAAEAADSSADAADDGEATDDGVGPVAQASGAAVAAAEESEDEAFVYGDDDEDLPRRSRSPARRLTRSRTISSRSARSRSLTPSRKSSWQSASRLACSPRRSWLRPSVPSGRRHGWTWSGSPTTAVGPRITCSRPTCGSWSRWLSAIPAAACCSWT